MVTDRSGAGGNATAGSPDPDLAGQGGLGGIMDPVPDANAEPKSGTRLKARMLIGEDGSRQWNYGWHDSQRDEDCTFTLASDGVMRCLPMTAAASAVGSGYFADAACSQPLAFVAVVGPCNGNTQKPPKSAYRAGPLCGATYSYEIYEVGAAFDGATIYVKSGASCLSTPTPASYAYYALGTQVPASSFVGAIEQVEP
jgi:hypothetical protein